MKKLKNKMIILSFFVNFMLIISVAGSSLSMIFKFEQNSINEDFMDVEPDVAEPETKPKTRPGTKPDTDREERPFTPGRPDRDPGRLPYEDPDTHPQGKRRGGGDLEDFVMKYLKNRG